MERHETAKPQLVRLAGVALSASLTASALLYFVWSWRWPLVGDASLMHYIGFLIERGWAPYRDFGDMNMPGSYLIELAAMHIFAPGALAWRLFDFTLLAAATAAIFSILKPADARRDNWFAALFASSLFILIHGRDGLAQGGQRDLTIAVCLLAATAFLLKGLQPPGKSWTAFAFGFFCGVALTIKPTTGLFTVAEILLAAYELRRRTAEGGSDRRVRLMHFFAFAGAGCLIAPAICLIFLLREHALGAFIAMLHGIIPYYASLGRHTLGYILLHSVSPVLSLVILWLAVLALNRPALLRPRLDLTRAILSIGVVFGLINCIVQARALPYYRYPLLAFLMPLMALDFTRAAQTQVETAPRGDIGGMWRARASTTLAAAAILVGGFFLSPQSAILIHRFRWQQTDFISALEQNLQALDGPRLNRHIQCIDTNSGCGNVLYNMRLEPATGLLSDFFLFDPAPGSSVPPVVRQTRDQFLHAMLTRPPQVIVVTSRLYLGELDNYRKLDLWPDFKLFLASNYTLTTDWSPTHTERWWSREEFPPGYRIYVLREQP